MPKGRAGSSALDGLIANIERAAPLAGTTRVSVDLLTPSPYQPRRQFDDARLAQLAASIREHGLLQPIVVRPVRGAYEVVAGERRLRAARMAGLMEVPVEVRDVTDERARLLAAAENLQREDLNVIDEIDAVLTLVTQTLGAASADEARVRLTALRNRPGEDAEATARLDALFAQLGRESWVSFAKNKLRVLGWPEEVLRAMREGSLPYRVAGVVAGAPEAHRAELLRLALAGGSIEELRGRLGELASREARPTDEARRVLKLATSEREVARLDPRARARLQKLIGQIAELFADTDG